MYSHKQLTFVILTIVITSKTYAGPLKRSGRTAREVYPEIEPENEGNQAQVCVVGDVAYSREQPVPAEHPCLKCKCRPPSVVCETVQCQKRPGCKAIHRPNKCCPDYQCECEFNGKFYGNGEKLEIQPGGECKVCYCRGGEIQCAEVSCYIRKDCEGRRVPGQCCPKYDHCPPIDALIERPVLTQEPSPATAINQQVFDLFNNSSDISRTSNEIQDDDSTLYNTTTQSTPVDEEPLKVPKLSETLPKITIQEIIPEKKEIPVTSSPKIEEPQGTLLIEEATDNTSNHVTTGDSDVDSSEILEIFHRAPPVLRVGDKLLFLRKDKLPENKTVSPPSVITIIGAEGLQRGGFEESGEVLEVKVENKNETEINSNKETVSLFDNLNDTNDLELRTSESTHILSLVRRKNNPTATTTSAPVEMLTVAQNQAPTETRTEQTNITIIDSHLEENSSENTTEEILFSKTDSDILDTTVLNNEQIVLASTLTPEPSSSTEPGTKSTEPIVVEQNPAYPPIPEFMSPYIEDTQKTEIEEDLENEANKNVSVNTKILPEILQIRNNKTVPENVTHGEWLKSNNNESLVDFKGSLPEDLLNQPAPGDTEMTTEPFTVMSTQTLNKEELKEITTTSTLNVVNAGDVSTIKIIVPELNLEASKSAESVEGIDIDSGESTTPKDSHASIKSNENASVEKEKGSSEATDMVSVTGENSGESVEIANKSVLEDVEMIDDVPTKSENQTNTTEKDVELINVDEISMSKVEKPEKIHEMLPKPVAMLDLPTKTVLKRESSKADEADTIFEELEKELNPQLTEKTLTTEEEQKEADDIFKELLEETNKPKQDSKPKSREAEALERVSNAIAQLTLSGKQPDSNILGVLSNFFTSQYRYYN